MSVGVRVEGLREFQRTLKQLDSAFPKALRVALNDAADVIAAEARRGVPARSGRARASVKARSTQKAARVVGGSRRVPYYPWLDFGGRVGRRKQTRRPFLTDGRYIYPAYYRKRDSGEFVDAIEKALVSVAERAGFEVT